MNIRTDSTKLKSLVLLGGTALIAWICWPLPLYLASGIVYSHRPEVGGPIRMFPGDHLQLMYYFSLVRDFITGQVPWFTNIHEFNVGSDAATYAPDFYYAPFSVIYTLGALVGTQAFSWNLVTLFSLLLGMAGTWKLMKRFDAPLPITFAATLVGSLLAYRWANILHGSPTGFSMAYVPWILWGLDVCILDRRMRGGWIAGLCLLFAAWGDTHTFFFSALLVPCWCLFCFLRQPSPSFTKKEIVSLLRALGGFIVMGLLVVAQVLWIRQQLKGSTMAEGRTLQEVMTHSPLPGGLWSLNPDHPNNHIYLGYAALSLILIGLGIAFIRFRQNRTAPETRHLVLHGLLFLGFLAVIALSLGPRLYPANPLWWERFCRVFPPYAMIRNPTKIFSILPPLMGILVLLPFANRRVRLPGLVGGLYLALSLGAVWELHQRVDVSVCLLDEENAAYAAIRDHADQNNYEARALAIVLWPGDTHWSSLYQHYSSLYGIRMVNGYRPNVPSGYLEDVFMPLHILNQGFLPDDRLQQLEEIGVRYLLLHEDAFPEKVSPFGVAQTLGRFLEHPRLRLLERDHAVWSFEITDRPSKEHVIQPPWEIASATMVWDVTRYRDPAHELIEPSPAGEPGPWLRLHPGDPALSIQPYQTEYRDSLRFALRVKGSGTLRTTFHHGGTPVASREHSVESETWQWIEIPFPEFSTSRDLGPVSIETVSGSLNLHLATLLEGPTTLDLAVGETLSIPATSLFHAGYTDLETQEVVLDPERVRADVILYGPRLPFPAGTYEVELRYRTDASDDEIGVFSLREPAPNPPIQVPVLANQSGARFTFTHDHNLPVVVAFRYARTQNMRVSEIVFTRRN